MLFYGVITKVLQKHDNEFCALIFFYVINFGKLKYIQGFHKIPI